MDGTVAITDFGWYESLLGQKCVEETNFWTPSAHFAFRGEKVLAIYLQTESEV